MSLQLPFAPAARGPAGRSLPWSTGSWISEVPSARKRGLDSRTVALPRGLPRPQRKFLGVTWGGLPTHPPTDPFVHLRARQPCFSAAAELTGWEDAPTGRSTPPGDSPIRGRTQHRALCIVCRVPRGGLQPPSCLPQPGQRPSLIPILVLAHLAFGEGDPPLDCDVVLFCAHGVFEAPPAARHVHCLSSCLGFSCVLFLLALFLSWVAALTGISGPPPGMLG